MHLIEISLVDWAIWSQKLGLRVLTIDTVHGSVVGFSIIFGQNFPVLIVFGKFLEVIDIIFIAFNIKTKIHSCKLLHLLKVDIVSKIITLEFPLFFSMLLKSLVKLFELFDSLENISLLRFDIVSLDEFDVLLGSKIIHSLSLNTTLTLNNIDLFLEHLLIFLCRVLLIFAIKMVSPTLKLVNLVGFFIQVGCSPWDRCSWVHFELIKKSNHSLCWLSTNGEPVPDLVLVKNNSSLDGPGLSGHPQTHLLDVFTVQVFLFRLHDNVPIRMVSHTHVTKL